MNELRTAVDIAYVCWKSIVPLSELLEFDEYIFLEPDDEYHCREQLIAEHGGLM